MEGGSRREKLNTRKELSKATETGEKSRFFRGAPKTETTPTVRGRIEMTGSLESRGRGVSKL